MITATKYKELFEKLGKTGKLTEEEMKQLREYECQANDLKYGKTHTEDHIDD